MRDYSTWDRIAAEISDDDDEEKCGVHDEDGNSDDINKINGIGIVDENGLASRKKGGAGESVKEKTKKNDNISIGGRIGETIEPSYGADSNSIRQRILSSNNSDTAATPTMNTKIAATSIRDGKTALCCSYWEDCGDRVILTLSFPTDSPYNSNKSKELRYESVKCAFTDNSVKLNITDNENAKQKESEVVYSFHRVKLPTAIEPETCSFRSVNS